MKNRLLIASFLIVISGCSVSGHYRGEGPCKGFHKDQQACEGAAENSQVIGKVSLGQSREEVRKIMGKDPERREVTSDSEEWRYITSYSGLRYTTITFVNGLVTSIR